MKNKSFNQWTVKEFESLPSRAWNNDVGEFDSLIILPSKVNLISVYIYWIRKYLSKIFKWIAEPNIYDINGLHDSGFRLMNFVAVLKDKPFIKLSGCSDVIHINGIGGLGENWVQKYGSVPNLIEPISWSIDCLPKSGLLRIFADRKITVGDALSSFEVFSKPSKTD